MFMAATPRRIFFISRVVPIILASTVAIVQYSWPVHSHTLGTFHLTFTVVSAMLLLLAAVFPAYMWLRYVSVLGVTGSFLSKLYHVAAVDIFGTWGDVFVIAMLCLLMLAVLVWSSAADYLTIIGGRKCSKVLKH